jgi:hypothetical protein
MDTKSRTRFLRDREICKKKSLSGSIPVEGGVLGVGGKSHSHFLDNCNPGNVRKLQCLPTVIHSVRDKQATVNTNKQHKQARGC